MRLEPGLEFGLAGAGVVGRARNRQRPLNGDGDDAVEAAVQVGPLGEGRQEPRVFARALGVERGLALEAISLPRKHVDEVELDHGPAGDVGEGARRAHLGEADGVVVDHRHGALGRQVRRAVGVDAGDEAERVVADERLHGGGQDGHGGSLGQVGALPR